MYKVEFIGKPAGADEEKYSFEVIKLKNVEKAVKYQFITSRNGVVINKKTAISDNIRMLELLIVDELREMIDGFESEGTEIKLISETYSLIKKNSYHCPKCGRKLFESWGEVKGVAIKCLRCRSISIPVAR